MYTSVRQSPASGTLLIPLPEASREVTERQRVQPPPSVVMSQKTLTGGMGPGPSGSMV